jgi:predicted dehydrogenase
VFFYHSGMKTTAIFLGIFVYAATIFSAEIKVGIIGLDTSHVIAFTQLLNDTNNPQYIPGARVVCAFKGGSPDVEASASRIEGFTKQIQEKFGIPIVTSIEELCQRVDAVMIESVDGRKHLEQAIPVFQHKKPVFIDKPLAGSLQDALEIWRLSRKHSVPVFSSSAYRFYESLAEVKTNNVGEIRSVISWGPAYLEPHHPDLYWYGVHPIEALFTILGRGCIAVSRISTKNSDIVSAEWQNGKTATLIGLRDSAAGHRVIVLGSKGVAEQKGSGNYAPLVREIVKFFQTGKPPVSLEETVEIMAFMEAADESKRQNGAKITIKDILIKNNGADFPLQN